MKLETHYEIGDTIFFINNNKVLSNTIRGFSISVSGPDKSVNIVCLCNSDEDARVLLKVDENRCYPSKEELLKSL